MQLVEKHIIKNTNPYYKELDLICFNSKNIYNYSLYHWRQEYIKSGKGIPMMEMYYKLKETDLYTILPQNVFTQTLKLLYQNINSFFKALKSYYKNPKKFQGKPKLPNYKNPITGRMLAIYTTRVIPKRKFLKDGLIRLTDCSLKIKTKITDINSIKQVRIIPRNNHFVVEIVYEKEEKPPKENNNISAIDLGLNNLTTVSFNDGKEPFIINGRPMKSINQFYNKRKAQLQSKLKKNQYTSKRIQTLTNKRNNKISDYLHKASRYIVNQLVSKNISKLIIGYNKQWKQDINIGKRNNQNFVNIPFYQFIYMLEYKCKLEGIEVVTHEESYTSKCSFLDNEPIKKHENYVGKRIQRGLFQSAKGILINADLNGSYNIMRKVIPNFNEGIEGFVVIPKVISL